MRSERVWAGGILMVLLALAGCGGVQEAQVSGTVKVDGEPLEKGVIRFMPPDGKTKPPRVDIIKGHYSVKIPVGTWKVSISAPKVVGKKKLYDTPNSPERDVTKETLPERYNEQTELTVDVKPGVINEKNFDDLKSK